MSKDNRGNLTIGTKLIVLLGTICYTELSREPPKVPFEDFSECGLYCILVIWLWMHRTVDVEQYLIRKFKSLFKIK